MICSGLSDANYHSGWLHRQVRDLGYCRRRFCGPFSVFPFFFILFFGVLCLCFGDASWSFFWDHSVLDMTFEDKRLCFDDSNFTLCLFSFFFLFFFIFRTLQESFTNLLSWRHGSDCRLWRDKTGWSYFLQPCYTNPNPDVTKPVGHIFCSPVTRSRFCTFWTRFFFAALCSRLLSTHDRRLLR